MTTTKKTKVSTAVTVAVQSFADEVMARVLAVEAGQDEVNTGRKGIMATLATTYGEQAIMRAKQGGISGNAMRTEDSIKAEALRLGITPGAARELYFGIIKPINALRANVWDDYQTAYFGEPETKALAAKDEPDNVKALRAEKAELIADRDAIKGEVKKLGEAIKAESDPVQALHLRGLQARSRLDAAQIDIEAKAVDLRIKQTIEDNAGADAYGTLYAAIKALGEKYRAHKDQETSDLAKALLTLL